MEAIFLQDLAVVMIVAGLVTVLFHRLRQPVVLGYLLAGLIIGPHALFGSFINPDSVNTLAELGVVFLLFSLGLRFSLRHLIDIGSTALLAGVIEITLMLWLGYEVGRLFGWSTTDSFFLGGMMAIASSTIIAKTLSDLGLAHESFARIIFGILIVEDVLAIALIALLPNLALGTPALGQAALALGGLAVFLGAVLVVGLLAVPFLLRYVARFQIPEMLLITVLGLCFGVALLSQRLGYSVALGSFMIGAVVGETAQRPRIEHLIEPLRDMFSAVFFVAMGMLIDPALLGRHWRETLLIALAVVVGKSFTCALGPFLFGHGLRTSLLVGLGMGTIGEFSFIIARLGQAKGVTSEFLLPIAVTVSAITALTGPHLIGHADFLAAALERLAPRSLQGYLEIYSRWMARWRQRPASTDPIRRLVRRTALQQLVNITLMAALFISAAYGVRKLLELPSLVRFATLANALGWLAAMLLSLPFMVAMLRKLRAMAMLVAELSVSHSAAREQTPVIRRVVSNVIILAGAAGLGLFILVLSSAILPPWPVLLVLLLVVLAIAVLMWRLFVQLYAKAQVVLAETLSRPAEGE